MDILLSSFLSFSAFTATFISGFWLGFKMRDKLKPKVDIIPFKCDLDNKSEIKFIYIKGKWQKTHCTHSNNGICLFNDKPCIFTPN